MENKTVNEQQPQAEMPWLEKNNTETPDDSKQSEAERIDFITTLMELEYR